MVTKIENIELEDLGSGVSRKILSYDENMMSVLVSFKQGSIGAVHSHPHEQIGVIMSGEFEYEEEGIKTRLVRGDSYYVAPNVLHGVIALTDGEILDVFTPMREDFLN